MHHDQFDRLNGEAFASFICEKCEGIFGAMSEKCPGCGSEGALSRIEITPKLYDDDLTIFDDSEMEDIHHCDPISASRVGASEKEQAGVASRHVPCGIPEFDRLFGGGLAPGSVNLIMGDPGSGKTTFLMRISESFARSGTSVLFISSEESFQQLSNKVSRLGISAPKLYISSLSDIDSAIGEVREFRPDVVVMDSISGFYRRTVDAVQSSHIQVRECMSHIVKEARDRNVPFILSAQNLYGSCRHEFDSISFFFDCMMTFESMPNNVRVLRARKTREGESGGIGVFEFDHSFMRGVGEAEHSAGMAGRGTAAESFGTGLVPFMAIEGSRAVFNEIEALVGPHSVPSPRWSIDPGISRDVFDTVASMIEKYLEIKLFDRNISVRLRRGGTVTDPCVELPLAASLISSYFGIPVSSRMLSSGRFLLSGETVVSENIEKLSSFLVSGCFDTLLSVTADPAHVSNYCTGFNFVNITNILNIQPSLYNLSLKRRDI